MPAPKKNRNAAKKPQDRRDCIITIRCTAKQKCAIVKAAGESSISAWMLGRATQ